MTRGTYTNQRLDNKLIASLQNGRTLYIPKNLEMDIYDAAENYRLNDTPLLVIAGKDYGIGSSRDWSVKGPWMLVSKYLIRT
jgi:aconitate hydratase